MADHQRQQISWETDPTHSIEPVSDDDNSEDDALPSYTLPKTGTRDHAAFSVRYGAQDFDSRALSLVAKLGAVLIAGAAAIAVKRLFCRKRLSVENAWAWSTAGATEKTERSDVVNLSKPMGGMTFIVAENIPVQGRSVAFGAAALPSPTSSHNIVRKLSDSGARLCGASRIDACPPHTVAACATCSKVGNTGHAGRLVMGAHGAACALIASGRADFAVGIDSGGEALLPAACMGLYALRTTQDAEILSDINLLQPTSTCACPTVVFSGPGNLLKVSKALKLPGGSAEPDELRMMLAADLFIMTEKVAGEKVTNGIVTRAITSWLSDREHARQVELLSWLAKETTGWDSFSPKPRGPPEPEQILLGISAAHKAIEDYEWQQSAPESRGWLGTASCIDGEDPPVVEKSTYDAALKLRKSFRDGIRKALPPGVLMVLPVLAGAAPHVKSPVAQLDSKVLPMAVMSQHFMAFVAMAGCPAAVLPVPALDSKGAPWAVLMVGGHKYDVQLAKYAAKMGAHIQKTASIMIEEKKQKKNPQRTNGVKQLSQSEKEAQSQAFKEKGNTAVMAGKYPEAVALYTAALELTPSSNVLYSNRAQAYISMQRYELAIQDCDASLRCKFSVKAALRRGTACEALGLFQQAGDSFRAVLQREPHNLQAREALRECEAALAESSEQAMYMSSQPAGQDETGML